MNESTKFTPLEYDQAVVYVPIGIQPHIAYLREPNGDYLPEADNYGKLFAAAPELYEALKEILGFFESGEFIRDTSRDFEQGWHLKMIPVVKSLADANAALAKAEGRQ